MVNVNKYYIAKILVVSSVEDYHIFKQYNGNYVKHACVRHLEGNWYKDALSNEIYSISSGSNIKPGMLVISSNNKAPLLPLGEFVSKPKLSKKVFKKTVEAVLKEFNGGISNNDNRCVRKLPLDNGFVLQWIEGEEGPTPRKK